MSTPKDDLIDRARAQLVQCPSCDFGLSNFGCACPDGDPRSVIQDLIDELGDQRDRIAELQLALDQERGVA